MPNWCFNALYVDNEKTLEALEERFADEKGELDFNKIIPMPESLDVECGSSNAGDMYYYLSDHLQLSVDEVRMIPDSKLIENEYATDASKNRDNLKHLCGQMTERAEKGEITEKNYEAGRTLIDNYHKYGAITWFQWCNEHWGTKWNSSSTCWEGEFVSFDTAWDAPVPVLEKLQELFPEDTFLIYSDNKDGTSNIYQTMSGKIRLVCKRERLEEYNEETGKDWKVTWLDDSLNLEDTDFEY